MKVAIAIAVLLIGWHLVAVWRRKRWERKLIDLRLAQISRVSRLDEEETIG